MRDYWKWLVHELTALVRDSSTQNKDVLRFHFEGTSLVSSNIQKKTKKTRPVEIELPEHAGLVRELSEVRLPASSLRRVAQLDADTCLPQSTKELECLLETSAPAVGGTCYLAAKSETIERALSQLSSLGIRCSSIALTLNDRTFALENDYLKQYQQVAWRRPATSLFTVGTLVAILALGTVGHEFAKIRAAHNVVSQNLAAARKDVKLIVAKQRQQAERLRTIEVVRASQLQQLPVSRVVEELSRLVPDTIWLSDLRVDQKEIVFSGFARSAATLIPILETSELFSKPALSGRVLRATGQNSERFSVRMEPAQ